MDHSRDEDTSGLIWDDNHLEEDDVQPLVERSGHRHRKGNKVVLRGYSRPRRLCVVCAIVSVVSISTYLLSSKPKAPPASHIEEEQDIVYQSNSSDVLSSTDTESLDSKGGSAYRYPPIIPNVAWIMSFGGSGTSYTILNTEALTGQSTASNYARDYDTLVPVHPDYPQGPYIRSLDKPLPPDYILTKTHCGGYCMDCPPAAYYIPSTDNFLTSCLSGHAHDMFNEMTTTAYSRTIPQRAVHLIRSPFDNVVGRFHLSIKRFTQRGVDVSRYTNDAKGLQAWCQYLDTTYREVTLAKIPELRSFVDTTPCYAEWFRYIQWHNQATAVTDLLELPVHYLWYDNYTHAFDATVDGLFDFLHLEAVDAPYEWHAGHSYRDFFPEPEAAIDMMRALATDETWRLISSYADEYMATQAKVENDDDDDDDDGLEEEEAHNTNTEDDVQVAWLLSFPNSGTSYTITNVEHMTGATTATNYARDYPLDAVALTPNGPYLHNTDKPVPHTVLTKTHCFGYCSDCGPESYRPKDPEDFLQGCLRVDRPGGNGEAHYAKAVPERIVHLFRNPLDNVVSRMHLALKKMEQDGWTAEQLSKYDTSSEGLRSWCHDRDEAYATEEVRSFSEDLVELFTSVPCHADFYRYTIWHNQAIAVAAELDIPVHFLFYEDYTTNYDGTVSALLEFLDLRATNDPLAFEPGKVYRELYEDISDIARLVEAVATPETWALVKHYFT